MNDKKKIIVIADDLSGAAEIGGIGLRHGLQVTVATEPIDADVDLLVIASDTRSMPPQKAKKTIAEITKKALLFNPYFIYKKTDSVLRGNISEEIEAQLEVENKNKAIIIAANPIFDRLIIEGEYFVNGEPLHKNSVWKDAKSPIKSNLVLDILSPCKKFPVVNIKPGDRLPDNGLIVGDVKTVEDLALWTTCFEASTLLAGAAGFFDALLVQLNISSKHIPESIPKFGESSLFVLGSYYPKDASLLREMIQHGHVLHNMPEDVYQNNDLNNVAFKKWVDDVNHSLDQDKKVIIGTLYPKIKTEGASTRIKETIAKLVEAVFKHSTPKNLLIEGGSTASEILQALNINTLTPLQELGPGVIRMKVDNYPELCLTTKPGSYFWPRSVWHPDEIKKLNQQKLTTQSEYE